MIKIWFSALQEQLIKTKRNDCYNNKYAKYLPGKNLTLTNHLFFYCHQENMQKAGE